MSMDLIKEKIDQAAGILNELDIDLWLVVVRETSLMADPVLPLVIGEDVVWQSFFVFTRDGETAALVGNFDRDLFVRTQRFDEVLTYTQEAGTALRKLIKQFNPQKIAVNYSTDNPAADGLTHGMFLMLYRYLAETPYKDRLVSAQGFCSKLRSRKLPAEIDLLSNAAKAGCMAWDAAMVQIAPGLTEIEIGNIIDTCIAETGGQPSFPTIVNAGDKSDPGHGRPTEATLEAGDLLHVDFGVRLEGYCSDIQRLIYFRKSAKEKPPKELVKAFDTIMGIVEKTADACRPGMEGWEVDAMARKILTDAGYPEYPHALGHQLGRDAHDGGAVLGPKWDRYGTTPMIPLEIGNVFTLELGVRLEGIGYVGLEEDVALEDSGARFLCPRQKKLIVQ
jgi:Xaa-Pro aminopeptidase